MTVSESVKPDGAARRPADRPRGFYEVKNLWSKDTETKYFKGFWSKVGWPLVKLGILVAFWICGYQNDIRSIVIIAATVGLILAYQHVVAAISGLHVMPSMDAGCFVGTSLANVNIMSVSFFDGKFTEEGMR